MRRFAKQIVSERTTSHTGVIMRTAQSNFSLIVKQKHTRRTVAEQNIKVDLLCYVNTWLLYYLIGYLLSYQLDRIALDAEGG